MERAGPRPPSKSMVEPFLSWGQPFPLPHSPGLAELEEGEKRKGRVEEPKSHKLCTLCASRNISGQTLGL